MTNDKGIFIKNIYYMLAYAFQVLRQKNYDNVAAEDFDNVQDLFAAILAVGMFALLKGPCGIDYKISNFFSVAIAICFAFVVNKLYVFQSKSESFADTIHEFIKFVLGRLVTMAVEVGGVPFCVEILHQPQMIAKLETQVIVTIVNYFISKFLVFKSQKK